VALLEERFFAITFKAEFDELVKAVKMVTYFFALSGGNSVW